MTIFIAAAVALAAAPAVAPAAPPPIIVTVPPAPPSPAEYRRAMERLAQPPAILDLRISGDGGLLWEGSLRVGGAGASVHNERSEAEAANCPRETSVYGASVRTSFSV